MFLVLLIISLTINLFVTNDPILIASPYPFNTSKSSHIECFSNDQGIILSLTILATLLDTNEEISSLNSAQDNIVQNGSIILTIPTLFNYSQFNSKIECRSKYYHGEQKYTELDVFSVAEIPQKEYLSINTYTNQIVTIHCLTYGTDVFIHWDFSDDISKNIFNSLPIGIRIDHKFIMNDTLIIDHVSYSDHYGYYRCYARNKLLDEIYEDKSIYFLNIKKNSIWIPIVIVCVVIGICILLLILCSKYCRKKAKNQLEEKQISQEKEEVIGNIKQIEIHQNNIQDLSHSENSIKSQISLLTTEQDEVTIAKISPQFILGNPFLHSNVQLINKHK